MSMENLARVLVTDFKVDQEYLRRMYLMKLVELDGKVVVENDVYFNPVIKTDTSRPHEIKIDRKIYKIPQRTGWKNDSF